MVLWPELSLVAGDAVAAALRTEAAVDAELSHPNDVLIDGRKVAGVLGESDAQRVVLGIGINANVPPEELPREVRIPATSLLVEAGAPVDRIELLVKLLAALERRYDAWA